MKIYIYCIDILSFVKKYWDLDELHMYDLYTPLVKDVKMEINL